MRNIADRAVRLIETLVTSDYEHAEIKGEAN